MPQKDPDQSRWFAEEILPHEPKLRAWLRSRFPTVTDRDDLVQEAYARLMQAHATGPIACPRAFLFVTARNIALNHLRHQRIERPAGAAEIDALEVADERADIPGALAHAEDFQLLIRAIQALRSDELATRAKELGAPVELVRYVHQHGKLPVPNFAAGGIATPADAALCMSLGAEAVFVGSGIFKSNDPEARARAVVHATTHWKEPGEVLAASRGLGAAMPGIEISTIPENERLANRGW